MCCCRCVLATIVVSAPVAKSVANKLQRRRRRPKLCGLPQSLFSTAVLTILHFYIWSQISAVAHFSYFMPVAAIAVAIDRIRGCKHYENSRHSNFSMFNVFSKECFALMALKAHYWALWSWERTMQTCFFAKITRVTLWPSVSPIDMISVIECCYHNCVTGLLGVLLGQLWHKLTWFVLLGQRKQILEIFTQRWNRSHPVLFSSPSSL